jgi:hypothetical protein
MKRIFAISIAVLYVAVVTWAHGNEKHVIGTVTAISVNSITVQPREKEAKPTTVSVIPSTKFLKSGMPASLADLKVGERVVIHAKPNGQKLEADTVEFGKPPQGMKPMSGMAHPND